LQFGWSLGSLVNERRDCRRDDADLETRARGRQCLLAIDLVRGSLRSGPPGLPL
jgi:hypothetical protein